MKVAHVIQSIDPRFGGPSAVVMRLASAQADLGVGVSIVTVSSENERRCFDDWVGGPGPIANPDLVLLRGSWIHNFLGDDAVVDLLRRNDIIHIHGVWNSLAARCLSTRVSGGARIVLAPHGMLTRWSMLQKKAKKNLAWNLWVRSALTRVDRFHVLNDDEGAELRALLPNARVNVLPNGTKLPESRPRSNSPARPYLLFLARLHPVKGPDRLIDAFAHGVRTAACHPIFDS
jgi:glycosyltransferase involved in cell wall biosynthesis